MEKKDSGKKERENDPNQKKMKDRRRPDKEVESDKEINTRITMTN